MGPARPRRWDNAVIESLVTRPWKVERAAWHFRDQGGRPGPGSPPWIEDYNHIRAAPGHPAVHYGPPSAWDWPAVAGREAPVIAAGNKTQEGGFAAHYRWLPLSPSGGTPPREGKGAAPPCPSRLLAAPPAAAATCVGRP